jgi:phage baseplate assembly protein gpV
MIDIYDPNTTILPTKDLPWAQAMIPLNNSKQFSTPSVGEWVLGFYMDGEQAQMPIMMGVLPGIKA